MRGKTARLFDTYAWLSDWTRIVLRQSRVVNDV